jgi:fructokinase
MKRGSKVFCVGETVLDIIFRDDNPVAAKPGGSMLNSAVSLGRAGVPVYFISDYGTDHAGDIIHGFLLKNGVRTDYISRYTDGKTAMALAFLDDRQNATYSFYKLFPEKRLPGAMPVVDSGDIILFGSFYALTASLRSKITEFIQQAKARGAYIIYDPNFRSAHLGELETLRPWIIGNIGMSSMVRGSDEDFRNIFSAHDALQAYQHVREAGCPVLVYTKNSRGVDVIAPGYSHAYAVPQILPVSTIGAGDAFNAGMIFACTTHTWSDILNGAGTLTGLMWDQLISTAIRFSENVCQSMDNYISVELGDQLITER